MSVDYTDRDPEQPARPFRLSQPNLTCGDAMILSRLLAVAVLPTLVFPPQMLMAQQKMESAKPGQLDGYSKAASETERQREA